MDFMVALPRSGGFDTVLVVVDRFTKYAHFADLKHPFTVISVASLFVSEIVMVFPFQLCWIATRSHESVLEGAFPIARHDFIT